MLDILQAAFEMIMTVLVLILASGVLKGFDPLLNLVLDGTTEHLRGIVLS